VYIFSPSVFADPVWGPVREMCEKELGPDGARSRSCSTATKPGELAEVIKHPEAR
jgi:hypothetical protein